MNPLKSLTLLALITATVGGYAQNRGNVNRGNAFFASARNLANNIQNDRQQIQSNINTNIAFPNGVNPSFDNVVGNVGNIAIVNNVGNNFNAPSQHQMVQQINDFNEQINFQINANPRNQGRNKQVQNRGNRGVEINLDIPEVQQEDRGGNRGNGVNINVVEIELNVPQMASNDNSNERDFSMNLNKIELPSPKAINLNLDLNLVKNTKPVSTSMSGTAISTTKTKIKRDRIKTPGKFKRNVLNPTKTWFKRHFASKHRKIKVKLTCCF